MFARALVWQAQASRCKATTQNIEGRISRYDALRETMKDRFIHTYALDQSIVACNHAPQMWWVTDRDRQTDRQTRSKLLRTNLRKHSHLTDTVR